MTQKFTPLYYETMLREEINTYCKKWAGQPLNDEMKKGIKNIIAKFIERHDLITSAEMIDHSIDIPEQKESKQAPQARCNRRGFLFV